MSMIRGLKPKPSFAAAVCYEPDAPPDPDANMGGCCSVDVTPEPPAEILPDPENGEKSTITVVKAGKNMIMRGLSRDYESHIAFAGAHRVMSSYAWSICPATASIPSHMLSKPSSRLGSFRPETHERLETSCPMALDWTLSSAKGALKSFLTKGNHQGPTHLPRAV